MKRWSLACSSPTKCSLEKGYLDQLQQDIQQLADTLRAQNEQGQLATRWVEQFKQQVRGQA